MIKVRATGLDNDGRCEKCGIQDSQELDMRPGVITEDKYFYCLSCGFRIGEIKVHYFDNTLNDIINQRGNN